MPLYNVHIYREMRLFFPAIEAESPEAAANIAAARPTEDAECAEPCDGQDLAALVDLADDEDFEHSRLINFEPERLRKSAGQLLEGLEQAVAILDRIAEALHYDDGEPVTFLEARAVEDIYSDAISELATFETLIRTVRDSHDG